MQLLKWFSIVVQISCIVLILLLRKDAKQIGLFLNVIFELQNNLSSNISSIVLLCSRLLLNLDHERIKFLYNFGILFNFRVDTFEHRHTNNFSLHLKSSLCSQNLPIYLLNAEYDTVALFAYLLYMCLYWTYPSPFVCL